jgi:histidinol dehydrogenase
MGVIPARIAGVKEIIVCNPKPYPATIVAADLAGAGRIFKVGGAQAIAAMAYGTATIPKVDKIVGPGNRYVTAAKYIISKDCGIDMLAGPSEIMVIADSCANPEWIAADLIAQAEHDLDARIYCLTLSKKLIPVIQKELQGQINEQPNKKVISKVLKNSYIILADNIGQCINLANIIAPEHLALHIKNPNRLINQLKNYGTLLVGGNSAVAFGDYVTGSNHILPTNGAARYNGGLGVLDFLKCVTYQAVSRSGASYYAKIASPLARREGLYGHLKSMAIRVYS